MRAANIFFGAVAAPWFALFLTGRDLTRRVYLQGQGIAPNAGQIDYYIIYPLLAVVLLALGAWAANTWRKPLLTVVPSFIIGFAIFPYLLGYTGGI